MVNASDVDAILSNAKLSSHVAEMHSTMALAATNGAPWVHIDDGQDLGPAWGEGVIEIESEASRLVPSILGIPKEHAQQMSSACLPIGSLICLASMHDAQVVDELYVALFAIEPCTESFRQFLNNVHGVHMLVRDLRHGWIALDLRAPEEWRFDELAYGLAP